MDEATVYLVVMDLSPIKVVTATLKSASHLARVFKAHATFPGTRCPVVGHIAN